MIATTDHATTDLAATLLARATVMRLDLAALAEQQTTHEAQVAVEQAAKVMAYVVTTLEGI